MMSEMDAISTAAAEQDAAPLTPELKCLGGQTAPADLGPSLARILLLPTAAAQHFAELLSAHLSDDATDDQVQVTVRRFCRNHDADPEHAYGAVQACRILLRGAARWNVLADEFVQDVAALLPAELRQPVVELIGPYYNDSFPKLRELAAVRSLIEHSQVVRGVSWRVDVLKHSEHAVEMNVPVVTLTFACQHAGEDQQISMQLLPAELTALRDTCNNILR